MRGAEWPQGVPARAAARLVARPLPAHPAARFPIRGSWLPSAAPVAASSWILAGLIDLGQELAQMPELIAVDRGIGYNHRANKNDELGLLHIVIAVLEGFAETGNITQTRNLIG